MKDVRREEGYLCTGLMIQYFREQQPRWLQTYLAGKESDEKGLSALMRLCQRFAARHGFTFWDEKKYGSFPLDAIYNVDETAVYFDMPSLKIWALKGRKGSAKVKRTQKHPGRLTAVITARADGSYFLFPLYFY
ncbi:uncharacterized protein PITG_04446 [Phytophthora infestans T30-4]|uniref:Uncharacterized protein n=1 Tax=Phytophthora infestans (strain T30-4) TaxID=403677 RepID=D0N1A1_PHYIT|nr:uncharacterized protein PITG_04446 [Phytophthora infestans T30-4]EEY67414.1 conserved hypothetical protein [Phytophthora infestans T30-4]|eukprot:XP_002906062.1 conserved hypothetical protein [Phytophthora infestans T30-4]